MLFLRFNNSLLHFKETFWNKTRELARKGKVTTNGDTENIWKNYCRNLFNVVSEDMQEWRKKKRTKITGHADTEYKLLCVCVCVYVYMCVYKTHK
jgi:hypothetical protein